MIMRDFLLSGLVVTTLLWSVPLLNLFLEFLVTEIFKVYRQPASSLSPVSVYGTRFQSRMGLRF